MTCFIQAERQAGAVTKSSYTGAIHPARAQLTLEACSLSLTHTHTYSWVHAVNAHQHAYIRINSLLNTLPADISGWALTEIAI